MRLSRYIAEAGITSRRKAEILIANGRIKVNGKPVNEQGFTVDINKDIVELDNKVIEPINNKIYIMLNKPVNYLSTVHDPQGRATVISLLKGIKQRVYPVGRLDYDTEGLLLLSNDGDFTNLMIHPRYHISKKYQVWLQGNIDQKALRQLRQGVRLEDGITAPARAALIKSQNQQSLIELEIFEGRKRQVKRMCSKIGFPVLKLKRTAFGFLTLGDLLPGNYRYLQQHEVDGLISLAQRGANSNADNLQRERER